MNSMIYKEKERMILNYFGIDEVEDQYSRVDGLIETDEMIIITEIKTRNLQSFRYDHHFLEKDKYDSMIEIAKKNRNKKIKMFYINHFNDDVVLIYNLNNLNKALKTKETDVYYEERRMMNDTTATDFRNAGVKKMKTIYNLNSKYAKKIKFEF